MSRLAWYRALVVGGAIALLEALCWSSAPNGSSSRMRRGCITSVRAMQTRWRMPPDSCAG
jgi:hypothetical protein